MKKIATSIIALALCAVVAAPALASSPVRISQVYGGGGGSTGTYIYDYIELFNASGSPVSIGGWTVQYGSATGTSFGSTASNLAAIPAGAVIQPCGYYLIQCGTAGSGGVALPVTADAVAAGPNISASTGKLALINTPWAGSGYGCSGNVPTGGVIVDVVGWGPTANCFETAPAPVLTNASSNVRNGGGTIDTDNNANDFTVSATPTPRNSQSPANTDCVSTPVTPNTWGRIKTIYR